MVYEHKKHDGSLPLIGVNTFLCVPIVEDHSDEIATEIELIRSTEEREGRADCQREDVWRRAKCAGAGESAHAAEHGPGAEECVRAVDEGGEVQLVGADQPRVV